MARVLNMPGSAPAEMPGLDDLVENPAHAMGLPAETVKALLVKHATVGHLLLGRLLTIPLVADNRHLEHAVAQPQSPYLNAQAAAGYLCIKRSRLDHLRRQGCVPAALSGKEYTYRREDLDQLRKKIEQATRIIPRKFLTSLGPRKKLKGSR